MCICECICVFMFMCMYMKNGRGTMKPSSGGSSGKDTMGKCEHSDDRFDSFCCSAKTPNSQHCKPRGESPTRREPGKQA